MNHCISLKIYCNVAEGNTNFPTKRNERKILKLFAKDKKKERKNIIHYDVESLETKNTLVDEEML